MFSSHYFSFSRLSFLVRREILDQIELMCLGFPPKHQR